MNDNVNSIISRLEQAFQRKEAIIADKDRIIAEKDDIIAERGAIIAEKDRIIRDKDGTIHNQQVVMHDRQVVIDNQQAVIHNQNLAIDNLNLQLITHQHAFWWRITKPMRVLTRGVRKVVGTIPGSRYIYYKIRRLPYEKNSNPEVNGTPEAPPLEQEISVIEQPDDSFIEQNNNSIEQQYTYDCEYQNDIDYSFFSTDIKAIAFYLPQFHTIPENDVWWGEGFTEWTNTRKCTPRFTNHYQPREPHPDIGYYDLSKLETLKWQVQLAKKHKIYGFCFYYYWFSGKRLLEKPLDLFLNNKDLDINFCICWANENWTRSWNGDNENVLMKQEYTFQDSENFMDDAKKYIDDDRYIRIDNKPVIIVYNPAQIPNTKSCFLQWRKKARELGIGEIYIWICQSSGNTSARLDITDYIDAEIEFPPHIVTDLPLNFNLDGREAYIYDYARLVELMKSRDILPSKVNLFLTCMMGWDNAARRQEKWTTFHNYSLRDFYDWTRCIIKYTRNKFENKNRFVFVNAWNEWGEGTYLEPDKKYGYANINTLSSAICDIPYTGMLKVVGENNSKCDISCTTMKIAVHVHIYYVELIDEILSYINNIPYEYDCFISTDTRIKSNIIYEEFNKKCNAKNISIGIYENRGRDVAPFIFQMTEYIDNYDYICHIHTKKTAGSKYGISWRKYLYKHLLGSSIYVENIFNEFEKNPNIGIIFPYRHPTIKNQVEWGGNKEMCFELLNSMDLSVEVSSDPVFPAGNMFWARTKAIKNIFSANLNKESFPEESGQLNLTTAHAIERLWVYIARANSYEHCYMYNNIYADISKSKKKRIVLYLHYNKDDVLADCDVETLKKIRNVTSNIVFISNSQLSSKEKTTLKPYVRNILERENIGFDFSAWKFAIDTIGYKNICKYDELILLNNSFYPPVYNLNAVFNEMDKRDNNDFWGITQFPKLSSSYLDPDDENLECIPEHLQSYFIVFRKHVVNHEAFYNFWQSVKDNKTIKDVIKNCEIRLTPKLAEAGFKYSAYLEDSDLLCPILNSYSLPYAYPFEMFLCGSPIIKKKCYNEMDEEQRIYLEYICKMIYDSSPLIYEQRGC